MKVDSPRRIVVLEWISLVVSRRGHLVISPRLTLPLVFRCEESFAPEFFHSAIDVGTGYQRLPNIFIKFNVESGINLFVGVNGKVTESTPKSKSVRGSCFVRSAMVHLLSEHLTILHGFEYGTSLVQGSTLAGCALGVLVSIYFDVDLKEVHDCVFRQLGLGTVFPESNGQQTYNDEPK